MTKVAMIGVGKLGQPCAEVMAKHYDVVGYDVEPKNPLFPMKSTIEEAVSGRDLIFIAAPTPHDPIYGGETPTSHLPVKDFDYSITIDILKEVKSTECFAVCKSISLTLMFSFVNIVVFICIYTHDDKNKNSTTVLYRLDRN